jgi:hypothetical protein
VNHDPARARGVRLCLEASATLCRQERLNAAERASCAPGYGCNNSTLIKLLAVLCRRIALPSGPGIDMSIDVVDRFVGFSAGGDGLEPSPRLIDLEPNCAPRKSSGIEIGVRAGALDPEHGPQAVWRRR